MKEGRAQEWFAQTKIREFFPSENRYNKRNYQSRHLVSIWTLMLSTGKEVKEERVMSGDYLKKKGGKGVKILHKRKKKKKKRHFGMNQLHKIFIS